MNIKTWQRISIAVALLSLAIIVIEVHSTNGCYDLYWDSSTESFNAGVDTCVSYYAPYSQIALLVLIICAVYLIYTAVTRRGIFSRKNPDSHSNPILSGFAQIRTANTPAPQAQSLDIQQELQKAADMLKGGLIDEEEYKALKAKIISKS